MNKVVSDCGHWFLRGAFVGTVLMAYASVSLGQSWSQFRGPNFAGRAIGDQPLPTKIGPDAHVVWKTPLPPGHSSPVVVGDRVYVTGVRDKRLVTIGLDRITGQIAWETEAPYEKLETVHSIGNAAQPSPAADGERVVVLFGSCGLHGYDTSGRLVWKQPMGPFNNDFGAGSSPVLDGDRVLLCQDHDKDSFLAAYDKRTGQRLWKTERPDVLRNYCSPLVWQVNGRKQIVVAATLRVIGYDFESGKEIWSVGGFSRTVCMTPVIGDDNVLYVAGWAAGGDAGEPIAFEPFDDVRQARDANQNGRLEADELPAGDVKQRFTQVDRDKDGSLTREEYEFFRGLFRQGRNQVLALKPGGTGEISGSHVIWRQTKFVPFCASPLFHNGTLYTVKDGGIFSSLDGRSGQFVKTARLPATGDYYASPVAGDGKIYVANDDGKLVVLAAEPQWRVLHTAEFGEEIHATPALVNGRIYLRIAGHLYCFGL